MKKILGFTKKLRSKEEIDKEYAAEAFNLAQKYRAIDQIQTEINTHVARMNNLLREPFKKEDKKDV